MTMPPLPPSTPDDDGRRWYEGGEDPNARSWSERDAFGKRTRDDESRGIDPSDDPDGRRFDAGNRKLASAVRILIVVFVAVLVLFYVVQLLGAGPGSLLERDTSGGGPTQHALASPV